MFILIRALVYATFFIGFLLIAVPARLLSASGLTSPSLAGPVQLAGASLAIAGALVAVACILTFVVIGRGTPAPFDPPRKLVARGPYRFVRNPMYLGAAMAMSGAAIVYRSWLLIGYVAVFLAITHAFVVCYEEPTLRRTFGTAYDDYCRRVGRWWPAVLAWTLVLAGALCAQWPVVASGQADATWHDPSPHQTRFVEVEPSVRLEVLDWGGSGPPLVLLACYISAHTYDEIAPKLTNQFHVYGITRRGIGASDKPATGYAVHESANDVIEVFKALKVEKSLLVGHSCAGQILTMFAARHSDRLLGLVYLDGASDPTMTPVDVGSPMPDPTMLPSPIKPRSAPDHTSFEALRVSQRRDRGWAFPEGELRQQFGANPDGSVGESLLSPTIRRAITVDARVKPDYSHIKVPVLAIYQKDPPFQQVAVNFRIRNEQERAALRQEHAATRALYVRWQRDLLAAVHTARIVELEGASLYMFLSNEADVIRELKAFAATLAANR